MCLVLLKGAHPLLAAHQQLLHLPQPLRRDGLPGFQAQLLAQGRFQQGRGDLHFILMGGAHTPQTATPAVRRRQRPCSARDTAWAEG